MAFAFKKGMKVRQIPIAPIVGEVVDYALDKETGDIVAKVEWLEKDEQDVQHTHSRFFKESELEEVKEEVEEPAA